MSKRQLIGNFTGWAVGLGLAVATGFIWPGMPGWSAFVIGLTLGYGGWILGGYVANHSELPRLRRRALPWYSDRR